MTMFKRLICLGLTTAAIAALCSPALANVIYTYTGAQYTNISNNQPGPAPATYTTAMSITGTITLANALGANIANQTLTPLNFSFSDGVHTYTLANSGGSAFTSFTNFSTNGLGQITGWNFRIDDLTAQGPGGAAFIIHSDTIDAAEAHRCDLTQNPGQCNTLSGISTAAVVRRGAWTSPTLAAVPEPGILSLVALGLFAMGSRRRRNTRA
jgi:hypothetical protein